jgi:hypothetical protein
LFATENLTDYKVVLVLLIGGFFVGFGSRYAGGCTSGHGIVGMSNLEVPSLNCGYRIFYRRYFYNLVGLAFPFQILIGLIFFIIHKLDHIRYHEIYKIFIGWDNFWNYFE